MFKFKGINHLAMVTGDMDKTIRFWRDLLGMRLVGGQGDAGFRQYLFEIAPGSFLSFYEWPGVEPIGERDAGRVIGGKVAFDHICFELGSEDELWELKDKMDAVGEWVSEVIDNGFIHSIYAFDPNNIPIEFCFSMEGIDVDRDMKMADNNPSKNAMEGRNPLWDKWPGKINPTPKNERKAYKGDLKIVITGEDKWQKE